MFHRTHRTHRTSRLTIPVAACLGLGATGVASRQSVRAVVDTVTAVRTGLHLSAR